MQKNAIFLAQSLTNIIQKKCTFCFQRKMSDQFRLCEDIDTTCLALISTQNIY